MDQNATFIHVMELALLNPLYVTVEDFASLLISVIVLIPTLETVVRIRFVLEKAASIRKFVLIMELALLLCLLAYFIAPMDLVATLPDLQTYPHSVIQILTLLPLIFIPHLPILVYIGHMTEVERHLCNLD